MHNFSIKIKMLYVLVILGCVWSVNGYASGPPTSACVDMTPNHGVTADPSTPPFTVTPSSDTYHSGQEITVTVSADDGMTLFKGFFIQARSAGSTDPVGSFFMGRETEIDIVSCPGGTGTSNGISHDSNVYKTSKSFIWMHEGGADVFFQATFVRNLTKFWTNVRSKTLTEVNMTETSTAATTTTAINTTATTTTIQPSNSNQRVSSGPLFCLMGVLSLFYLQN